MTYMSKPMTAVSFRAQVARKEDCLYVIAYPTTPVYVYI